MTHTGRCYCGEINFEFDDPIHSQLLCHCRECRYLSGGEPNASIVITEENFPPRPGMLVLKIGTLDDHSWFSPQASIYCIDKQPFHQVRDNVPNFERTPPPK